MAQTIAPESTKKSMGENRFANRKGHEMKTYGFSIIAYGLDQNADDFETRFYNAGCDDALVSLQKGHIILDFARESVSMEEAISSAIENVRAAGATAITLAANAKSPAAG